MNMQQIINLQRAVGVHDDGIIGRGTLTAVFKKLGAKADVAAILGQAANVWFKQFGLLDDYKLFAHFLAQAAHETGGFQWFTELSSGKQYENRKDLGNNLPGDGVKYKGRGIFQLTGKENYRVFSILSGVDVLTDPQRAAEPDISLYLACVYWKQRKMDIPGLGDDIKAVTYLINGGTTHLAERVIQLKNIYSWLKI